MFDTTTPRSNYLVPQRKRSKKVWSDAFRKDVIKRENFPKRVLSDTTLLLYVCLPSGKFSQQRGTRGHPIPDFLWRPKMFLWSSTGHNFFEAPWDNFVITLTKLWDNFDCTDYWRSVHLPHGQHMAIFFLYSLKFQFGDYSFQQNVLACCCC